MISHCLVVDELGIPEDVKRCSSRRKIQFLYKNVDICYGRYEIEAFAFLSRAISKYVQDYADVLILCEILKMLWM